LQQNSRAKDYIDKAYDKGIAVVVVDHDAPGSKRDAYIGTNKLLLGKKAGQMVFKYGEADSQTLIILGSDYTDPSGSATNNYMNGFRQVMEESKLSADILIAYASQNHVELILEEALIEGRINVVVCTDPQDTIRVMHQLIDFNRVKDIVLIGSGDLPQIQQAVRDGIIKASVVVDYKQMGVEAMEAYLSLTRGLAQTAYKTIPIDVLE
jgi:ribose transport system substrate-binding protein